MTARVRLLTCTRRLWFPGGDRSQRAMVARSGPACELSGVPGELDLIGKAAVLKTAGRKPFRVRVPGSPSAAGPTQGIARVRAEHGMAQLVRAAVWLTVPSEFSNELVSANQITDRCAVRWNRRLAARGVQRPLRVTPMASMSQRQIRSSEGTTIRVWEKKDPIDPSYDSKNSLSANGWLIFSTDHGSRELRLYPRDWCKLPEQRLRELYGRARPARYT